MFYLQQMEQMSVITWLLLPVSISIDPLCGQYPVTPDPQTALALSIHTDLVIFEHLNKI